MPIWCVAFPFWGDSIFDDPISHRASGEPGDDELRGCERDYLFEGSGDDTLVMHNGGRTGGGSGADTFRLLGSDVDVTIDDFDSDEGDVLELSSVGSRVRPDPMFDTFDRSRSGRTCT